MNDREIIKNLAYQVIKLADIIDSLTKNEYKYSELQAMQNATCNLISELTEDT